VASFLKRSHPHVDEVLTGSAVSLFIGYLTNVFMFGPGQFSPIHTKD
jgi:hypothetical protein